MAFLGPKMYDDGLRAWSCFPAEFPFRHSGDKVQVVTFRPQPRAAHAGPLVRAGHAGHTMVLLMIGSLNELP